MSALSDRIAAEHWFTLHEGWHCVGCGYSDIGRGEDFGAASRRHLADVTERAVRDAIAQQLEAMPLGTHIDRVSGRTMAHAVRTEASRIAREGTTP